MIRYLIILLFFLISSVCYSDTGWQTYLENNSTFDQINTFEDVDDWTPSVGFYGVNADPDDLPKKSGVTTKLAGYQYWDASTVPTGTWIGDHGSDYTLNDKSLQMSFDNTSIDDLDLCGPSILFFMIGGSDTACTKDQGYEEFYAFYGVRFRYDLIDLNGTGYSWEPTGTNNEYYLQYNSGNPGLYMPNNLIINGVWVVDPVVIGGSSPAGQYPTRDDEIGSLAAGDWCYGDPASLGYETIIVRLSDGTDPDTKGSGYIQYENGTFVWTSATAAEWVGTYKFSFATQGFWWDSTTSPYFQFYDQTGLTTCTGASSTSYGVNFSIINMTSYQGNLFLASADTNANVAIWSGTCYGYETSDSGGNYLNTGLNTYIKNGWLYIQHHYVKGTCDGSDGSITTSYYAPNGTLLGSVAHTGLTMCQTTAGAADLDNPFNQFHFGGNRLGTLYAYDASDSWDNRYYFDDVIFDDAEIATTYFSLVSSYTGTAPTLDAINVQTSGNTTQFDFSENMAVGADGYLNFDTLVLSGGSVTLSGCSITGDVVECTNSRQVSYGETFVSFAYTQPGDGLQDTATTPNNLASIVTYSGSFTNNVPEPGTSTIQTVSNTGTIQAVSNTGTVRTITN